MAKLIPIYFMGKKYMVPEGYTILKAIEHSGYNLIRGCGCRGGFCGACATVYRVPGNHALKVGLACQTQIEEGMILAILPSFPANKALYDIKEIDDYVTAIREAYPEVFRCLGCNACSKICPQDIPVPATRSRCTHTGCHCGDFPDAPDPRHHRVPALCLLEQTRSCWTDQQHPLVGLPRPVQLARPDVLRQ